MPTILMAPEASLATSRSRRGRSGALIKRLVTSLAVTLLIAFAFALAIQAAGTAPARDPVARMERAQMLRSTAAKR